MSLQIVFFLKVAGYKQKWAIQEAQGRILRSGFFIHFLVWMQLIVLWLFSNIGLIEILSFRKERVHVLCILSSPSWSTYKDGWLFSLC